MADHYGLQNGRSKKSNYYRIVKGYEKPFENRGHHVIRKNRLSKQQLWWLEFSQQTSSKNNGSKVFFNDYQLVDVKRKSSHLFSNSASNRDGRVNSCKIIRYRRSNTNNQQRDFKYERRKRAKQHQYSMNSSRKSLTRPVSRNINSQSGKISSNFSQKQSFKRPSSKSHMEKQKTLPLNRSLKKKESQSKLIFQLPSVKDSFEKFRPSVIQQQDKHSQGVPSIIVAKKLDSKISTSNNNGRIKLKNSGKNSLNSLMLSVNSRRSSRTIGADSCQLLGFTLMDNYLETLNILAQYSQGIVENYEEVHEWDQLIFLSYKKFYLERKKLVSALKFKQYNFFPQYFTKNIKKTELKEFMNSNQCKQLRKQFELQNIKILQSLRNLYNLAIQKSGQYVNMIETDNFSKQIFKLMSEQITQLQPLFELSREEVTVRIKSILNCAETICLLNRMEEQEKQFKKLQNSQINKSFFTKVLDFLNEEFLSYI